jgi:hypothetical protein
VLSTGVSWQQPVRLAQPYPGVSAAPYSPAPRKKSAGKIVAFVAVVVLVLAVLAAAALLVSSRIAREERYKDLTRNMMSVTRYNISSIGQQIDEFPLDYRDIRQIRAEYNKISKYIAVISDSVLTEQSSEECRTACAALVEFQGETDRWDLSGYLEDMVFGHRRGMLIYGREWKTADGLYSFFWRSQEDDQLLTTSLPNEKSADKQYYFYTDNENSPTRFGYENQEDSDDFFDAYEIVDVSCDSGKWQLQIFCFSDSKTYTLE